MISKYDTFSGEKSCFVSKAPSNITQGNIVSIFGTARDKKERGNKEKLVQQNRELCLKQEAQTVVIQEYEEFSLLVHKAAHDICSPLAALRILADKCTLPENQRALLKRVTESIIDIANDLKSNYKKKGQLTIAKVETPKPLLVLDLLAQLIDEKRIQYEQYAVEFELKLTDDAKVAFILMQRIEFRRAISNLINNAVDALEGKAKGIVTVQLLVDGNSVLVGIHDNGKGMTEHNVGKILGRHSFTEGKKHGHGLGLQQVWDMLAHNQGIMSVQSIVGKGTSIQLTFPRLAHQNV